MGLLDPQQDYEQAKQQGFATGPTEGVWDRFLSAPGEALRTQSSIGEGIAFQQALSENAETYERITGVPPKWIEADQPLLDKHGAPRVTQNRVEALNRQITELIERQPEYAPLFRFDYEDRASEIIAEAEAESQQARQNMAPGWGTAVADWSGSTLGLLADPMVLATLPLGSAGGGLARIAAREAGIAAVSESAIQVGVQNYRRRAGLEAGFQEGAENVAAATVGAFGLTVLGGALARGVQRRLEGRRPTLREQKDAMAADALARRAEEEAGYPGGLTREEQEVVRADVDATYNAVLEGEPPTRARMDTYNEPPWMEQRFEPLERVLRDEELPEAARAELRARDALVRNYFSLAQTQARASATETAARLTSETNRSTLRRLADLEGELRDNRIEIMRLAEAENRLARGQPVDPQVLRRVVDRETVDRLAAIQEELATPGLKTKRRSELLVEEQMVRESIADEAIGRLANRRRRAERQTEQVDQARRELLRQPSPDELEVLNRGRLVSDRVLRELTGQRVRRKQQAAEAEVDPRPEPEVQVQRRPETPVRSAEQADAVRTDMETEQAVNQLDELSEAQERVAREYAEQNPDLVVSRGPDGRATLTLRQEWAEVDAREQFVNEFTRCIRG